MNIELWKKRKKELNLTHDELAKRSGVSRRTIAGIFSKDPTRCSPTRNTAEAIENALGLNNEQITDTIKTNISPIEDDMLDLFRQIGEKHGEEAQKALIIIAKKML